MRVGLSAGITCAVAAVTSKAPMSGASTTAFEVHAVLMSALYDARDLGESR